jgi:hypothetical protein
MMVHGDGSTGIFMHHGLVDVEKHIEKIHLIFVTLTMSD